MGSEIRCGRCGRLLGKLEKGIFVNKHGRQIIRAERAVVTCPKCGAENVAGARYGETGGEPEKKGT